MCPHIVNTNQKKGISLMCGWQWQLISMIEEVITSGGEVQPFNILISLTEKSGCCSLIAAQSWREERVLIIFEEAVSV